jgi:hypothetical protein
MRCCDSQPLGLPLECGSPTRSRAFALRAPKVVGVKLLEGRQLSRREADMIAADGGSFLQRGGIVSGSFSFSSQAHAAASAAVGSSSRSASKPAKVRSRYLEALAPTVVEILDGVQDPPLRAGPARRFRAADGGDLERVAVAGQLAQEGGHVDLGHLEDLENVLDRDRPSLLGLELVPLAFPLGQQRIDLAQAQATPGQLDLEPVDHAPHRHIVHSHLEPKPDAISRS